MIINRAERGPICALGLDIGGTKIAGGIVLPTGETRHKKVIPTAPQRGGSAVLKDALDLAEGLLAEAEDGSLTVAGIGIGVPELVDLDGRLASAHLMAWPQRSLQATFARLAPTVVESDVRAAALAEALYGAGRTYDIFAYVTVGTGISYCLMLQGRPYAGARGNALLLGSSPQTFQCPHCSRVSAPILEDEAAGPGLARRYNARLAPTAERPRTPVDSGEAVLAAVAAGDAHATAVVQSAGEMLGVSVGWLVNVLDPAAVIVGGGLGSAEGAYWNSFVAATRDHIWSDTNRDLPITHARLGPDAGFIGAAATVFRRRTELEAHL